MSDQKSQTEALKALAGGLMVRVMTIGGSVNQYAYCGSKHVGGEDDGIADHLEPIGTDMDGDVWVRLAPAGRNLARKHLNATID